MAATIPTIEPAIIRAGDSSSWTRVFSDYPVGTYTLTYYFRGPTVLDVTATTSGSSFLVSLSSSTTAQLQAGEYWWEAKVTGSSETVTVGSGSTKVLPNFADSAQVQAGYDGRSHARKCLDAINAMMEGRASAPQLSYTIVGQRTVQMLTPKELIEWRGYYAGIVAQEDKATNAANGKRTGVFIRFVNPV